MLKEQSLKEPGWKGYLIQILSGILQPIPIKEFKEVFFYLFFIFNHNPNWSSVFLF